MKPPVLPPSTPLINKSEPVIPSKTWLLESVKTTEPVPNSWVTAEPVVQDGLQIAADDVVLVRVSVASIGVPGKGIRTSAIGIAPGVKAK